MPRASTSPIKTLLCIDDNEEGLAIRKLFLETFNYAVLTAASAREGLELLASNPVDAIILDYRMPGVGGDEVAREARRLKPEVPILMLSGYPSAVPESTRSMVDSFVVKGRPPTELLAEIDRLVHARPGANRRLSPSKAMNIFRKWEAAVQQAEERTQRHKRVHEQELRQAEEALHSTEKLALAGRLSASIAHEINNPLESVAGLLHLLEQEATLTERGRHYLSLAREELQRIAAIARQTLSLHRETPEPVMVRLPDLLDGLLELYQPKLRAKDIHVSRAFDPVTDVCAFPGELRQVFSNLILNAVQAAGQGGRLRLHVFNARDWRRPHLSGVSVSVADDGPGIPPRFRDNLFKPFFTTKGEHGTGLGLWLTSRIVHKHGGSIKMRSSVRRGRSGTVFQVFLPRQIPRANGGDRILPMAA